MKSLKFRIIETKAMSIRETTWNLQIEDTDIIAIANFFRDHGLGTYSDAISCVMPLLRSQLHSHHDSLVLMLIQAATEYRQKAEWLRAERVLRCACDLHYEKNTQGKNKKMLYRSSVNFIAGHSSLVIEASEKSGIKWMVSEFKGNEISTRYDEIFKKINTDNDHYQWHSKQI